MAVRGVGGHLAWVCAWRDGDGVSLDLRHFAIALRLASRRPTHTGHSVDTTAFVKTTAADLCRRYSGQPAFEFVADGSATEKFEKSDFWIFSFLLKSGPVHTPTAAGGGGGVAGRSLPALDVRPSWTFAAWKWDPILYSGLFFPQR